MIVWAVAPLVLSVIAAVTAGSVVGGRPGRQQSLNIAAVAIGLTVASAASLALLAWYGLARMPLVAHLGAWSSSEVGRESPVPATVSWVASLLLGVMAFRAARCLGRELGALRAAQHCVPATHEAELVRLDSPVVDAFAVARWLDRRGRVVVTDGLLDAVPDESLRRAVMGHEIAHLRHHHYALRVAVRAASAANPLLVPLARRLDFALERWADDEAAAKSGRADTAAAIATVALARSHADSTQRLGALYAAQSHVVERVQALLAPEPAQRRISTSWASGLVAVALFALAAGCRSTEGFFEHVIR